MENSVSEVEMHQSFRSPPRRRRSTFFERRESIAQLNDNVDSNMNTKDKKREEDLTSYYEKLQAEKAQWKKEVTKRQQIYHDYRMQYNLAVKKPSKSIMAYNTLTDEDINFLRGRENISNVIKSQQKLHNSVLELIEIQKTIDEAEEVVLTECEDKLQRINNYILENSTV